MNILGLTKDAVKNKRKTLVNIGFSWRTLRSSPLKVRNETRLPTVPSYIQYCVGVISIELEEPDSIIGKEKEIKS